MISAGVQEFLGWHEVGSVAELSDRCSADLFPWSVGAVLEGFFDPAAGSDPPRRSDSRSRVR